MGKPYGKTIGPFSVAAREQGETYAGAIFHDGKRIEMQAGMASQKEAEDWTLRRVNELVREQIDLQEVPSHAQVVEAFATLPPLSAGYRQMLKAHLHAPDRRITATELTKAADYAGVQSAANLHYGTLAHEVWCKLPRHLPIDERTDVPIWTFMLADGKRAQPSDEWVWTMRPHIADALLELGY